MKTLTPEQIKARLQEVGMTQKQLAERLKMQPARLSEMINGKREMPEEVEEMIKIALWSKPGLDFEVVAHIPDPFGPGKNNESEEELQADARQFAQDDPGIKEVRLGDDNNILEVIIDLIQSRRYLGLRHKKRLIEDLKGLEL